MKIPEVRKEMNKLADELSVAADAERLRELANELVRRPQHRRRENVCRPVTDEIKAQVRHLRETTNISQYEIAKKLDINSGRVSEILHGFRE